ncbi:MAG TPA: hypothetical protein VJ440_01615, partial [Candidatus Brocadiaceae bacterium]|nr:hypothetical protein [Candidatus Brocadiaceae bacterium]
RDRVLNPEPHEVEIFEFGASAAAFDIASTLDIVSIIDRHVRKRTNAGLSVGQYLLLAALYRHKVHKPLTKSYVRYICRPYLRSETFAGGTPEMTAIGISDMLSLNTRNLLLIERKTFIRFYPNPNESDQRKIFCFLTQRHEGTQFPVETQVKKE